MAEQMTETTPSTNRSFWRRFWWLWLVVATLVVIVLSANIFKRWQINRKNKDFISGPTIGPADQGQGSTQKDKDQGQLTSLPACKGSKELFSIFPVEDGKFKNIVPLGNLNPSSHTFPTDHIYVEVSDPRNPQTNTVANAKSLIAPADMWILSVQSSEEIGGITDYVIEFSPCKDIKGKFGHVGSIAQNIKTELDEQKANCIEYETGSKKYRNCKYDNLKIQVKSGDKIGTSGSERSGMLDIWLSDYREPQVKRANEKRWSVDRNYVACFLDYFPTAQKEQYYSFLRGPNNGKRTKEPRCGTVEVDITDTAQGVWFYNLQDQVQQEDSHLALTYDNVETDKQVLSIGTAAGSAGIASGAYFFAPQSTGQLNRDFSQVKADGTVYCYDTKNQRDGGSKSILLTMPSATKLRIGKPSTSTCGSGPWQMPANPVEYER